MNQNSLAIGVDLGGTNMRIGMVDHLGKVLKKIIVPTESGAGAKTILLTLSKEILLLQSDFKNMPLSAVGIAIAGQVEAKTGIVKFAPNLHWNNVAVAQELYQVLKVPIFVANDVRAATFGEWRFGAAKGMQDFICLFIGTGIGGGIVSGGKLMTGSGNSAGEVGHMAISIGGELCTCGNRGCWETHAAGWGIAKLTQNAIHNDPKHGSKILSLANGDIHQVNGKHLFQAFSDQDPFAENLVQGIEKALITGCVNLVNIFNPEALVFGGGVIEGAPWLIGTIEEGVHAQALKSATEKLKVLPAQNINDAAILGIATMAKEN